MESYKYLGLLLTAELSSSSHISPICLKARKILSLLYRRFYGNVSQDVLKQLYLSLMKPHLEYGCHVWNPHHVKDKKALENIQKLACRIGTAHWDESYDSLLELLNLQSLHERRTHARLGLLYRIQYKLSYFPEGTFNYEKAYCQVDVHTNWSSVCQHKFLHLVFCTSHCFCMELPT